MKTHFFLPITALVMLFALAAKIEKDPLKKLAALKDYVQVPAGEILIENTSTDVETFFMSKYEVTNQQYQAFLDDMQARGNQEILDIIQIKSIKPQSWKRDPVASDTAELPMYHSYKGYANFPVLNISHEAALLYCEWLAEQVAKENDTEYQISFRLPTREEWIRAARGNHPNGTYAWGSPYLKDGDGYYLCNFKRLSSEHIRYNIETDTYEIVPPSPRYSEEIAAGKWYVSTDAVDSYTYNDFGLHNMCGNVAEMITEEGKAVGGSWNDTGYDVRVESMQDYEEASPYVGFRPVMVMKK